MGGLELWFDCCVLGCWIWLLLDLVGTSGLGLAIALLWRLIVTL